MLVEALFCPQPADWGNVANWVSGCATSAAATTALFVAFRNAKKERERSQIEAEKAEQLEIKEAHNENAILAECVDMLDDLIRATDIILNSERATAPLHLGQWKTTLTAARERAMRLRQMPGLNVRAFRELEIVTELTREDKMTFHPFDRGFVSLASLKDKAVRISEGIKGSPNPRAPVSWAV